MKRGALLLLLLLAGCGAFRASVGVGLGVGGSAKVGPIDVGCLGGADLSIGNYYGSVGGHVAADLGIPGLARGEVVYFSKKDGRLGLSSPLVLPFYPALRASDDKGTQEAVPFLFPRPTEVAVSAYAVFLAVHLGFDVAGLVRPLARFVSLATGGDDDEPPMPATAVSTPPEDDLLEVPYHLVSLDDLAALESGTAIETNGRIRVLAKTVKEPLTLVAVDDGTRAFERFVEPRRGLEAYAFRSVETRDRVLGHEEGDLAATERRRGEALLERGAVAEAEWALEDALEHTPAGPEVADALARLAVVKKLRESSPPAPVVKNAHAGSADLGGILLGAQGSAVWCVTPAGDVAWERSDALPGGFVESKVIGVEAGLALLEVQSPVGRPWVFALDFDGRVAWKTPLPSALVTGSAADQFYVHGLGRLFVGRVDRVLALDATTGAVLWMTQRKDVEWAFALPRNIEPLDWRPPPGPPRRRPDGERGFRLALAPGALEMRTSASAPLFRFDPRTGRALPEK